MGCCFSSGEDKTSQGEISERTRLLGNPVSNNQGRSSPNDDYANGMGDLMQKKGDEQSALNRILHQTATNVIDVSAIGTHNLEPHEYMDRAKMYSQKIATSTTKYYLNHKLQGLLLDVPNHERTLAGECIAPTDLTLIEIFADKAAAALGDVKVLHQEDLVVQFGMP